MSQMSDTESAIHRFLDRYAGAIGAGDLEGIVGCWGIPAFVLSDRGIQPVTELKQVEEFFRRAVESYRSQGLAATRAEVRQIEWLGKTLCSVDVRWVNMDANRAEQGTEDMRYTLKTSADGQPRIHVAVMQ